MLTWLVLACVDEQLREKIHDMHLRSMLPDWMFHLVVATGVVLSALLWPAIVVESLLREREE